MGLYLILNFTVLTFSSLPPWVPLGGIAGNNFNKYILEHGSSYSSSYEGQWVTLNTSTLTVLVSQLYLYYTHILHFFPEAVI